MPLTDHNIESAYILRGENVSIGKNSFIKADEVALGNNVSIGDNVEIVCGKLALGDGCKIGNDTVLLCPEIHFEEGCTIGSSTQCELNEYFRLGRHSVVGNRVTIAGQGVSSGAFLWLKNDVIIGGGGSQGPNSYLNMGQRVAIMDKAFINLSEEVSIGDSTALSCNVILLTHGAAQPLLMGYAAKYAPVKIGSYCALYINSVVLPGVTIGDYSTIAACSLVNKDIPAHALASGNPARVVVKGKGNYPRELEHSEIDGLMAAVLTDYAGTLQPKGADVLGIVKDGPLTINVLFEQQQYVIMYFGENAVQLPGASLPDISLAYGEAPGNNTGKVHFNLKELSISGEPGVLAEDLREYLRRRSVRVYSDKPFRAIPLSNLSKLKEKRKTLRQK